MRGLRVAIAAGLCGLLATSAWAGDVGGDASGAVTSAPVPALAKAKEHWGMLEEYCEKCHNYTDWKGQIAFDTMVPQEVPKDAKIWEAALQKLRGRMMPPPGKPHPDEATRESFIHWIESYLDEAAARHPHPGYVALHRLNRKEYANAIHDLLAMDVDAAALLPKDDISDGFDNVADVLQVTPSFIEQYISAARTVAVEAVGDPTPQPSSKTYRADPDTTQQTHIEGLPLGTRGGLQVTHMFPADGDYVINIGNLAVALWVYNMEFKNHLIVTLDGKKVYDTVIGGDPDMKNIDQKQDPAVDAINARLKNIKFKATAGPHKVAVTFIQRDFAESDDRLQLLVPGGGQDQILRIRSFEVRGPFNPTGLSATPSREKIFICHPENTAAEEPCARKILANLARRAYRRPVEDADMAELMAFYQDGYKLGGFEQGVRMGLTGILSNPDFLYRPEPAPAGAKPGEAFRLTDLEIASRLSFFLWSTIPDDELLTVAAENKLHEPKVLAAEVKRMLASPKADTLADNFAYQWLELAKLDEVEPDPAIFPYASGAGDPREDFKKETTMFVNGIFRADRSILDLLTADYTYLNEKVALLYGITDVKGDHFQRVDSQGPGALWPSGQRRDPDGGVLSEPYGAGAARRMDHGQYHRHAADPAAAQRQGAEGERRRRDRADRARAYGAAPHRPVLQCLPRHSRSAGPRARQFQRGRRVAHQGPFRRHGDRRLGRAARRQPDRRPDRSQERADEASGPVRPDLRPEADDLCARPHDRLPGHADGAPDRPRDGGGQLQILVDRHGDRDQRPVPDE